jgi:hypothetical protein
MRLHEIERPFQQRAANHPTLNWDAPAARSRSSAARWLAERRAGRRPSSASSFGDEPVRWTKHVELALPRLRHQFVRQALRDCAIGEAAAAQFPPPS